MRQGLAARQSMGALCYSSGILSALAEAQGQAGQPETGLSTLAEAFAMIEETDEGYYKAELYRLQAELLLMLGDETEAEVSFEKAIEVARHQSAKSWELRAAIGLARLLQEQGKTDKARQALGEVYDWFTEGFDTPDLQEAKALLTELA